MGREDEAVTATKTPAIAPKDVAAAIVGGRKGIEAFVNALEPKDVLPFLALAGPAAKDFAYGVKLAESRVVSEGLVDVKEWKDKDGATHKSGEWMDADGVLHEWAGSIGDLYVADPAMLRSDLEMEDVPKIELDQAVYQEWKVNFTNLKNIENTFLRLSDLKRATDAQKAQAKRIIDIIRGHRDRKPDGPAHLKEKE